MLKTSVELRSNNIGRVKAVKENLASRARKREALERALIRDKLDVYNKPVHFEKKQKHYRQDHNKAGATSEAGGG